MENDLQYPEIDPNKKSALTIWSDRYNTNEYIFGKEPISLLQEIYPYLKTGKALDLAMGEGRNAVFLAQKGFQVEGIELCPKAVEKANLLAKEKNISLEAKVQNLDFFLMPLMKYDTIILSHFKPQARFFSEIRRGLVLGGNFLFEAHLMEQCRKTPDAPFLDFDQCYKPNEVLNLLKEFHIELYRELPAENRFLVQALVRKHR